MKYISGKVNDMERHKLVVSHNEILIYSSKLATLLLEK